MNQNYYRWLREPLFWFVAGVAVGAIAMVLLLHAEGRVAPGRLAAPPPTSAKFL